MPVKIRLGDCIKHENPAVICHGTNTLGAWGSGFVLSLSHINDNPEKCYRKWAKDKVTYDSKGNEIPFELGQVQFALLKTTPHIVANIISQEGVGLGKFGEIPFRYKETEIALRHIEQTLIKHNIKLDIVSPLIGCGLAMADLPKVYKIINDIYHKSPLDYYLYAYSDDDFENLKKVVDNHQIVC